MSLRCHWLWGHVVWFKVWRCGGPKNFSVLRQYYSVLQSTTPVLLCTTQYYASITLYYRVLQSITLYYKVLLQYYSVLPSTTTYYSVLQSTTPVLLCTTKYYNVLPSTTTYYSSTTLNKVTLQNSANIAPATQNESHPWSASHMKHRFQCVEQGKSPSNFTQYCACHEIFKLKISSESAWSASANAKTIRRYPRIIRR